MQKVSKQSLAMIALSILLAISIALTMTFAALSQTKHATGTITFTGNYSITMTGVENAAAADDWTFKGTFNADGKITLTDDPTVVFTNVSTGAKMHYGVKITTSGANAEHITVNYTADNGATDKFSTEESVSVALSSLINGNATIEWGSLVTSSTEDSGYEPLTFNVEIRVGNAASDIVFSA